MSRERRRSQVISCPQTRSQLLHHVSLYKEADKSSDSRLKGEGDTKVDDSEALTGQGVRGNDPEEPHQEHSQARHGPPDEQVGDEEGAV